MKPSLAIQLVEFTLEKHAPHLVNDGWTVQLHTRIKRRNGICCYRLKTIFIGEAFALANPIQEVEKTGKHETAHALVGSGHGHDDVWKNQARALGIVDPQACNATCTPPQGKFVAICPNPNCQRLFWAYRKPKVGAKRWCRECGPFKGNLTFIPYTPKPDAYDGDLDIDKIVDEI